MTQRKYPFRDLLRQGKSSVVSKAFEIAVGYVWKACRRKVRDEGLDPQSPKAALRDAMQTGFLDPGIEWVEFINARNAGVHNYFSLPEKDYVAIAERFLAQTRLDLGKLI